jgi:hypothetical protein
MHDDAMALRIVDGDHADRLVHRGIEALADRLDALDAVAAQHALELLAHHAHTLEHRGVAAAGLGCADRAIEVVEHRQQLAHELGAGLLRLAASIALEARLGRLEAAQGAQRHLAIGRLRRDRGIRRCSRRRRPAGRTAPEPARRSARARRASRRRSTAPDPGRGFRSSGAPGLQGTLAWFDRHVASGVMRRWFKSAPASARSVAQLAFARREIAQSVRPA